VVSGRSCLFIILEARSGRNRYTSHRAESYIATRWAIWSGGRSQPVAAQHAIAAAAHLWAECVTPRPVRGRMRPPGPTESVLFSAGRSRAAHGDGEKRAPILRPLPCATARPRGHRVMPCRLARMPRARRREGRVYPKKSRRKSGSSRAAN
jgi:hypothetical protein